MMLFYAAIGMALAMVVTAGVFGAVAAHRVGTGSSESVAVPAVWVVSLIAGACAIAFVASAVGGAVAQLA